MMDLSTWINCINIIMSIKIKLPKVYVRHDTSNVGRLKKKHEYIYKN